MWCTFLNGDNDSDDINDDENDYNDDNNNASGNTSCGDYGGGDADDLMALDIERPSNRFNNQGLIEPQSDPTCTSTRERNTHG